MDRQRQWILQRANEIMVKNDIEMYSAHNKGTPVVAERFIRTLKTKSINTRVQYQKMCILIN